MAPASRQHSAAHRPNCAGPLQWPWTSCCTTTVVQCQHHRLVFSTGTARVRARGRPAGDFEIRTRRQSRGEQRSVDDARRPQLRNPPNGPALQRWIYDYMLNRIRESANTICSPGSGVFRLRWSTSCGQSCSEDYKEYALKRCRELSQIARKYTYIRAAIAGESTMRSRTAEKRRAT